MAFADPLCLVMVESLAAIADLPLTLALDGVDGVYVGPRDLSLALGCALDPNDPVLRKELGDGGLRRGGQAGRVRRSERRRPGCTGRTAVGCSRSRSTRWPWPAPPPASWPRPAADGGRAVDGGRSAAGDPSASGGGPRR